MSREFYDRYHADVARTFASGGDGVSRHVECHVSADKIYVYLKEDDVTVLTEVVEVPGHWHDDWPRDETVRRHIRRCLDLGTARITTLDA